MSKINQTGLSMTSGYTRKTILVAPDFAVTLPVIVGNAGLVTDSDGKKILKAGTPIAGNLQARGTAFVRATTTAAVTGNLVVPSGGATVVLPEDAKSNVVAILLHDEDVTDGNANATAILTGVVDVSKLDTAVQALITDDVIAALKGSITFIK